MVDETPPTPTDAAFSDVMRWLMGAEAAAAVGAELARTLEGVAVPASIAAPLGQVAGLAVPGLHDAGMPQRRAMLGAIRALFRQAADLLADPSRPPGWSYSDAGTLDEQGRASRAFAPVLASLLDRLGPPPTDRRRFLDVGTGAGWLALGLADALPDAHIVGIDVWPPALECARRNVAAHGLGDRIAIEACDVQTLGHHGRFDAAWLPGPFLPESIVAPALTRVLASLRPGGLVIFGLYAGGDDPLTEALHALRTARSGGSPFTATEVEAQLEAAGYVGVHEPVRTWNLPMRVVIGCKG